MSLVSKRTAKNYHPFCYSCALCLLNPVEFWLIRESGGDEVWTKEANGLSLQEHLKEVSLCKFWGTQVSARRERGVDPCAALEHLLPIRCLYDSQLFGQIGPKGSCQ